MAAARQSAADKKRQARIEEAQAELAPGTATDKQAAPVYDERGNVRPHGTPGARPMSYEERVKIAKALEEGKTITTAAERKRNR